jgi:hypothetical protein
VLRSKPIFISLSALSLSLCALAQAGPPASVRSSAGIYFSSQIPDEQFKTMDQNLKELGEIPITKPDAKLASIMRLKDLSPASLLNWLKERVHFVIEESYDKRPDILKQDYMAPNFGAIPVNFGGTDAIKASNASDTRGETILTNIGSMHYMAAKNVGWLVSMFLPGIGDVTLTSPRAGIVQIGEGYFNESGLGVSSDSSVHNARRTLQLTTLFHEARHSDGHAYHLGFMHVECPQGHPLAGLPACDANLNGAYALESHLINSFDRSCEKCTLREHELLRMAAIDTASRVQEEIVDPKNDPVAVLKNTQVLSSMCNQVYGLGNHDPIPEDLERDCHNVPNLRRIAQMIKLGKYKIPTIVSTDWDPAPEGTFDINQDVKWLQ